MTSLMTSRLIDFQNYGTMVVDSLKRPSRRVEKENIQHRICIVTRKPSNQVFPESNRASRHWPEGSASLSVINSWLLTEQ